MKNKKLQNLNKKRKLEKRQVNFNIFIIFLDKKETEASSV